jgi:phage regulator Rha-like protein
MIDELEKALTEADQAVEDAKNLARAQEAQIARMKATGRKTSHAEAVLAAYQYGIDLATRRKNALEAVARKTLGT